MLGWSEASLTRSSPEGWWFPPTLNNHETSSDLKTNHQFQSFHLHVRPCCQSVLIAVQTSDGVCLSSGLIRIYHAPCTSYPESHGLIIISAEQQCLTNTCTSTADCRLWPVHDVSHSEGLASFLLADHFYHFVYLLSDFVITQNVIRVWFKYH